jgi:hypothetical protein
MILNVILDSRSRASATFTVRIELPQPRREKNSEKKSVAEERRFLSRTRFC